MTAASPRPVALEDHAVRACLAALSVQEQVKQLAVDVQHRDGVELRLRICLNSGQVIAGEIGSAALGYTAYRDNRNRYCAMATSLGFEGHMQWAEAMP